MLESGISNITMFFVITGIAVVFIVAWIIKSEARFKAARDQVRTLKSRLEAGERDRYILSEKLSSIDSAPRAEAGTQTAKEETPTKEKGVSKKKLDEAQKAKEALEEENKKLKAELAEATESLAEVYKALCEK